MVMADTMAIFLVILGLLITFPCLWLLLRGIWPTMVEETCGRVETGMWKSFFAGLPILVGTIVLVAILSKIPGGGGGVATIATICFAIIYASTGVSGLATHVGQRLPSPVDKERPWKGTLRGGIVLVFSWLLPFVGWFVILPFSLISGAGSVTRVVVTRLIKRPPRQSAKTTEHPVQDSGSKSTQEAVEV